ncbi:hypothetical protein [Streptomyces silvensis]|uniref:STAS domain-containing protein n=1 Tax=Streptomyces silvensis TaxID=1765722 RepID=A0A0W7X825_9ACTN|nr:hypothetical protein [Streptomyces silvensis]KUF18890.1 hypothetical protein AT728_07630 [Streptomyces silvensis]
MRGYFTDDQLLIIPLPDHPGVRLHGEALSTHRGPLLVAVTDEAQLNDEIVIDLTGLRVLATSVLETLILLALRLTPPQRLLLRAGSELELRERLHARGWDHIDTLRLAEA